MNEIMPYDPYYKEYPFTFSVIMAVYNVEPFIEEAIESLIEQSLLFEFHVQLILVNDGSTDNSGIICEKYQKDYPNNIVVVHKSNGGVSSARNAGLFFAKGKYINFMDPDDKVSENTFENVYYYFEKQYKKIDLIEIPTIFFDGKKGEHVLNKSKFSKGNRIIDFKKEYKCVSLALSRMFVKSTCLDEIRFDERLVTTEDGKIAQKIIFEKKKIGVVTSCKYYYRKRTKGEPSALDLAIENKKNYCDWLQFYALSLIHDTKNKNNKIPKYVQFTIMFDLQEKFKDDSYARLLLNKKEFLLYVYLLKEVLSYIDDSIILEQKKIYKEHKMFILNLKYGYQCQIMPKKDDVSFLHNDKIIYNLSEIYTKIHFIQYRNQVLSIEGRTMCLNCTEEEDIPVFVKVNGKKVPCTILEQNESTSVFDLVLSRIIAFKVEIPIEATVNKHKIEFYYQYRGILVKRKELRFGKFTPIGKELSAGYFFKDGKCLSVKDSMLLLESCGKKGIIKKELAFLKSVKEKQPSEYKKVACVRLSVIALRMIKNKQIWLVSDRIMRADDNGKAFFLHLQSNKKKYNNIKVYFLISKECTDYHEMKKLGKVIDYHSKWKKFLHLTADCVISSSIGIQVYNPFGDTYYLFRDLLNHQKNVFLQHGIIKDDMSNWLNKYKKNFGVFVTSTKGEYDSILNYDYYYSEKEVLLSGLPRHDLLYNNPHKYISIMPTWRTYLAVNHSPITGDWDLVENFTETEFFNFYNSLLNDEKFIESATENGYKIFFVPHPVLTPHIDLFNQHPKVEFICYDKSYRDIYAESDLVITDYSSAVFDFSYLRKPVVYTHFDKEDFFTEHYKPGYFEYERDGFGEVEYDLESTVARIIEYMENGCQLKDKYRERIDNFFAFNDKNNCQRVLDAILKLEE